MMFVNDIPHLKVYRQKTYLPRLDSTQSLYSLAVLNTPTFDSSVNTMKHPLILSGHKYLTYYIDPIYDEKIGTKVTKKNIRKYREGLYKEINTSFKMFMTPLAVNQSRGRNLYYDMHMYNQIFFNSLTSQQIFKRITMYFNYIKSIIDNEALSLYTTKVVLIDVNAWELSNNGVNNPIMYLFLAFKKLFDDFKNIGNINFIFFTNDMILRLNPSECRENDLTLFKRSLNALYKRINLDDDNAIDAEMKKEELRQTVTDSLRTKFRFTGDEETGEDDSEIDKIVEDIVSDEIDKAEAPEDIDVPKISKQEMENKIATRIQTDEVLLSDMSDAVKKRATGKTTASLKRDEELRKRQRAIKLKNVSYEDIEQSKQISIPIPTNDISKNVRTTNENVKTVKFANFEKSYNDELMARDTFKIINNLNDKSIPVYITDIDIKDTSDELNYKETYTIKLEDENRVRHTITVDMPKFIDDKFLYINGNKKVIIKQLFMKPIVKTGPDEVQICSNYNKIFIYRYGKKLSSKVERAKRTLPKDLGGIKLTSGDNTIINNGYRTTLEYDEFASSYSSITTSEYELLFNQKELEDKLKGYKIPEDSFPIGINRKTKQPILMNYETERIGDKDLVDYMRSILGEDFKKTYEKTTAGGTKFIYAHAKIMNTFVPIVLLLGYCEGISTVLKKANIKHRFSDTRVQVTDDEGIIKFADGYLIYDKYPILNSLVMNGFQSIQTSIAPYSAFDDKEIYVEFFDVLYNSRNLANAFDSFYEFMIDPITAEVLDDLDYPTDFVSVVLAATELLGDNSYIMENNMNLYRVRSNEVVNAILHRQIADAYGRYRATANNPHPVRMSIPRDAVIKQLSTLSTVEEFSTLNPIYELDKTRSATPKGVNGMNLDDAYTQDKRSYDKTMIGIVGMSTSPDANAGVVRRLSLEPNIKNARGYIDINDDDLDSLKDVNLFTPAEMLSPLGASRDDSTRTAMASKQSSHIVPVANASPVLISNGSEQSIHYYLSKDFAVIAEDDGVVSEVDETSGLIIVTYKNGKSQAIDINSKVAKNSSSGFYISNKLRCNLKKGQKVKKNDILASDEKFFTDEPINGNRFNIGVLEKAAVASAYSTYEDSAFITKKMSEDFTSEIIMMKDVVIGKNANIDKIVNIGDNVDVGDTLVSFETSYDADGMNTFLASVGDELQEEIKSLSKVPIKSSYAGVIADIKVYSSVETSELSPSLQKLVKHYYAISNRKKKLLDKYDKDGSVVKAGILFNEPTGKISPSSDGKIKGREIFDGVLIEFYVKYRDPMGVGDKITYFTALKSVICEVVDEGYEPYSEFRPDEEVSAFIGPLAILARMTPSIVLTMFANKVIVELKRNLKEIYDEK